MVVFVSNYFNHHQRQLSDELYALTKGEYCFIQTMPMEEERKQLGWEEKNFPKYVLRSYTDRSAYEACLELINEAEIVISGSCPSQMLRNRVRSGKLTFAYAERPLKKGMKHWEYLPRFFIWRFKYVYSDKMLLLCASAYTAADYSKFFMYKNRCYKWGYFPETKQYENVGELISKKKTASILWAARLIDWKHPEHAVEIARKLKEDGYSFSMRMIGTGELEKEIEEKIRSLGLENCVQMLGAMTPSAVREYMEESEIFLITSDFQEGWGAVLNEAMNSGCACVASHAIGSAPFLLQDNINGLVYKSGDLDDLYDKVKTLLNHPEKKKMFGENAYHTITETWNAKTAAQRFLKLCQGMESGISPEFADGPCSRAEILKNNWM